MTVFYQINVSIIIEDYVSIIISCVNVGAQNCCHFLPELMLQEKQWMNEWMNSMNVLFPDRLRYRECHWTSWLPAPLLGADFFACEWGNPDVSERVNRTTRIAQVFRYLLLSSIIMTAGASLHTSVNQHAQRHWCITPVVWQRHQDTHRSAIRPHTEAKWHRHMRDWTKRY